MFSLSACQSATPAPPITANVNEEFTLAPNQTAIIEGTDITVSLIGVGDARCPLDIECVESGPVTIAIKVQSGSNVSQDFILQVFTDNDGRVPDAQFEGIQDRVEFAGYLFRVRSALPFPRMSTSEIETDEYRVAFVVMKQGGG
jgi:hypothetical protein